MPAAKPRKSATAERKPPRPESGGALLRVGLHPWTVSVVQARDPNANRGLGDD